MQFLRSLRDAKKEHWAEASQWFIWSVGTGLLPIWGALFILRMYKQPISLGTLTDNGEFALYAAAYLGTALYTVNREDGKHLFPSRRWLSAIFVFLLLFSTLLYALAGSTNILGVAGSLNLRDILDKELLRRISIWLMPTVCLITYLVVVTENVMSRPPLKTMSEEAAKKLNDQFDKLGDQ